MRLKVTYYSRESCVDMFAFIAVNLRVEDSIPRIINFHIKRIDVEMIYIVCLSKGTGMNVEKKCGRQ